MIGSLEQTARRTDYAPTMFSVQKYVKETSDTYTLTLTSSATPAPFSFSPGQFNMVYVFGVGEVPISISGDPHDRSKVVHTVRAVGGVTKAMQGLRKGDQLGLRGPFGTAWPVKKAYGKDILIVAGGIGLAPLRPAIYEVLRHRKKFERVIILYGTRTPEDILFRKDIESWRGRLDTEVLVTVDRASGVWKGHVGVVTGLLHRLDLKEGHTVALLCGPEIMMRYAVQDLMHRMVTPEQIYVSMERNMQCGIGLCGHCQWGPYFICKDGPVFRYADIKNWMTRREI